ncbi:MAG: DNA/RNA nuclease SfsA [Gammaproteobacteria bacterium]|nr:DNA/RNA nuclease SfsA [Gammaproteobacteria bacterium]
MKYTQPILTGTLIKRYKRFLADVRLDNGEVITVHTPNTGAMLGCAEPGFRVWLYDSENLERKYRYSWLLVENNEGIKIGINTAAANTLVEEGIREGVIKELQGYSQVQREVKSPTGVSRFDLFLQHHSHLPDCYIEVKSVTAKGEDGVGIFPDAVSARGKKHLEDLRAMVALGFRAVLVFCVQREDVEQVRAAIEIDPLYANTLETVRKHGVEVIAYCAKLSPNQLSLVRRIPVL